MCGRILSDGPWLTLENGTDLMFCETKDETRMKYKVGEDPNFHMPMLMFQVEDIEKLHSSLKESGAEVEEIRDNRGCGLEFYFYDPEGNKHVAWEMQTVVTRQLDKLVFTNCYFEGSVSEFLSKVSANSRGTSKKVNFLDTNKLREEDPEGFQEVIDILQEFNLKHSESLTIIGL
ncbi:VOC family protein [Paenibacillus sp. GCM10027629]|uniref:VOC family protein n=1 Tax=Paenibacillus sp. GCM10027629 TaxID=3273414 RepID=UPI00363B7A63